MLLYFVRVGRHIMITVYEYNDGKFNIFLSYVIAEILFSDLPKFSDTMRNLTVSVGRDAILECVVESLSTFKVST